MQLIREATDDDAEALSHLLSDLGHRLAPDLVRGQLGEIRALAPRYATFVATLSGEVAGVVSAFASPVLHRPHAVGRISVLVVGSAFQDHGIGSALLHKAEEFLSVLGCGRIEVTSAAHRHAAHQFYVGRGYEQQGVRFARELHRL